MVLRNYKNRRDRKKMRRKSHKIKRKKQISAEKRYLDLSSNKKIEPGNPAFMRVSELLLCLLSTV